MCEVRRWEGKRLRRTEGRTGALALVGLRRSGMLDDVKLARRSIDRL